MTAVGQVLAVAVGSAAGGVGRWLVGLWLNPLWPHGFALGTLAVNVVGGLLIGATMAWLAAAPDEAWRLLLVTGFLGGLTTFSAFSHESLTLLQQGRAGMALAHALAHVLAALAAAALGAWLVRAAG
jgi:CrcB protein